MSSLGRLDRSMGGVGKRVEVSQADGVQKSVSTEASEVSVGSVQDKSDQFAVHQGGGAMDASIGEVGRVDGAPRQHRTSGVLRLQLGAAATTSASDAPILSDHTASGTAQQLYEALSGAVVNERQVMRLLSHRSTDELEQLRDAFADRYGASLDACVQKELDGVAWRKASLWLQGDDIATETRDAGLLQLAMDGVGTDEKAIFDILYGKDTTARAALRGAFQELTGDSLEQTLTKELRGAEEVYGLALYHRGKLDAADALRAAMRDLGTHEKAIFRTLDGLGADERADAVSAYQERYGRDLESDLKSELSTPQWLRASILLARGEVSGADELHIAMAPRGTDEKALLAVFDGLDAEERTAILDDYASRYGDLRADLRSELSDTLFAEMESLMARGSLSPAETLHRAMRGVGSDEEEIFAQLKGKTPDELSEIHAEFQTRYGQSLTGRLKRELRGSAEQKALLLATKGSLSLVEELYFTSKGVGADKDDVFALLEDANPTQREGLDAAFRAQFGKSWDEQMQDELSGHALKRAQLLTEHGELTLVQQLDLAMAGMGTREAELFEAIKDASVGERSAILDDPAMMSRMEAELRPKEREEALLLLQNGKLTTAQEVHFAMAGWGTDEERLLDALKSLKSDERQALMGEYREAYGEELLTALEGELGKRDLWKATDALAPKPKTLRERLARTEMRAARERGSGTVVGAFSDALMDVFGHTGRDIDHALRVYSSDVRQADAALVAAGTSTDAEALTDAIDSLDKQEKTIKALSKDYRKEKTAIAEAAGGVVALAVGSAAVAATGGLATLPAAAIITGSSATARVATSNLIVGESYDLLGEDGLTDFLKGAGEGLSMLTMGMAGDAVTSVIGKRVLAAQGTDVSAQGLLQLGRAVLGESGATASKAVLEKAAHKALKKAGRDFLKRSLTHKLAGAALLEAVEKGTYAGTKAMTAGLADEALHDMEFGDAVKRYLNKTLAASLKAAKKGVVAAPALEIGEMMSDAMLDHAKLLIGRRIAASGSFAPTDKELLKSGRKVLGDHAKDASEETLKALGRERLLRKLGDDAVDDSKVGSHLAGLFESLVSRTTESAVTIPFKHLSDREIWEDGWPQAVEALWREVSSDASDGFQKSGVRDVIMSIATDVGVVEEDSVAETFLANLIKRAASAEIE